MPKPIPCRPLWWRIPRAVVLALLFIAGIAFLFGTALWHSGGNQ